VGLQDQRRAVFGQQPLECVDRGFGRLVEHRQPGQLVTAGQIPYGDQIGPTAVNEPGRLRMGQSASCSRGLE